MSLTKRTWSSSFGGTPALTFTGSVTGATTKLTIVFQSSSWITGVTGTINVYVDGTKQSCTWTKKAEYNITAGGLQVLFEESAGLFFVSDRKNSLQMGEYW